MIDVTDRADIAVRLIPLKLRLGHFLLRQFAQSWAVRD
jgi:hypothetical protein